MDQASNQAGVSLWFADTLIATCALSVPPKSKLSYSRRVQYLVDQLTPWLTGLITKKGLIRTVVFEGVRSRHVLIAIGAFMTCPLIDAHLFKHTFIESTQWKSWASRHGATGPFLRIKGRTALRQTGWPEDKLPATDDEADSILIYQTWRDIRDEAGVQG